MIIRLHCLFIVKKDLGWYYMNAVLKKKEVAQDIDKSFNQAVKDLLPYANDILDSFGLPLVP